MDMGCCRTRLGVIQSIHFIGYCSIHTSIHSISSSAADAYVRGARPALSRDYDSHVGATLTMKPAGIAQMYPKNALGALEAISGGKGAGANVNKKRSLSFGTEEYWEERRVWRVAHAGNSVRWAWRIALAELGVARSANAITHFDLAVATKPQHGSSTATYDKI